MLAASGIAGTVVIDPAKPVCRAGQTCSAPDGNDTLVFSRNSHVVARSRTSAAGTFRVSLPPGVYRVTFPRQKLFESKIPPIRVVAGAYVRVHLSVDIGIR